MGDKFINGAGLSAIRTWILGKLGLKQDTLVSGQNIKTINGSAVLGSGNIQISGDSSVFIATRGVTTMAELHEAALYKKVIWIYSPTSGAQALRPVVGLTDHSGAITNSRFIMWYGAQIINGQAFVYQIDVTPEGWTDPVQIELAVASQLNDFVQKTDIATGSEYGIVKINPDEAVTLNANGQLDVGGRLGQFPGTTGVYSPKTISPEMVDNGSLLLTEGSGTTLGNKSLAVSTGRMQNVRSAAAGTTQYRVQNTYVNRIACAIVAASGAVAALNENEAKAGNFAKVLSVTIGGSSYTPDSSANKTDTANDIVIELEKTVNPSSTTTQIRFYPVEKAFSDIFVGQGVGGVNAGASVIVGQGVFSVSGNACALVGADIYNTGNGNAVFGRQHISRKNRWFMAGTGHDNTNGRSESGAALGEWSLISSDTAFAIGNGTSQTARSNLFEIKNNGDVYINGVKVH